MSFAAAPASPPALDSCLFYHAIDLPVLGVQRGLWDLRGAYDAYFGGHDFRGERVLDIGTANGGLAFEIERRGAAEVVGFDLADGLVYDCRLPMEEEKLAFFRDGITRLKNAFWLAHRLLESNVKVAYGHVGALPAALGRFDTVVIGNVLQHLQDPVGAILQAIRHTDRLIVTEADWMSDVPDDLNGMLMFDKPAPFSWYQLKPGLLQNLLGAWGFTEQALSFHTQYYADTDTHIRHFTLVMRRVR